MLTAPSLEPLCGQVGLAEGAHATNEKVLEMVALCDHLSSPPSPVKRLALREKTGAEANANVPSGPCAALARAWRDAFERIGSPLPLSPGASCARGRAAADGPWCDLNVRRVDRPALNAHLKDKTWALDPQLCGIAEILELDIVVIDKQAPSAHVWYHEFGSRNINRSRLWTAVLPHLLAQQRPSWQPEGGSARAEALLRGDRSVVRLIVLVWNGSHYEGTLPLN